MPKPIVPTYEDGTPILPERRPCYMDRYPNYVLIDELHRVRSMTLEEAQRWLEHPKHKRKTNFHSKNKDGTTTIIKLTAIREAVRQRVADINSAEKKYDQFKNKEELIKQYVEELNAVADSVIADKARSTKRATEVNGSKNRNTIFDLPSVKMGLYSVDAYYIKQKDPSFDLTEEHCLPRTVSAIRVFEAVIKHKQEDPNWKLTVRNILPHLFQSCLIVWTTKAENKRLEPYQKSANFEGIAESYSSADITVVDTNEGIQIPWQWNSLAQRYEVDLTQVEMPKFNEITSIDQLPLGSDSV